MYNKSITIATRESPLALWQANWVKAQLAATHPGLDIQLLGLTTQADRMPYISLAEIGGKGLFVKELEQALLDGRADLAVHSIKDMPVELPAELCLPAICVREMPWDAMVSNHYQSLAELPLGATVGTSSLRRQSQLLALRPDLITKKLRGNVNTRLARLDDQEYDAIILAAAGLQRLGLQHRMRQVLSVESFLPSAGQGALGIECRAADAEIMSLLHTLNDKDTASCVTAERAMCKALGVGCQVPVAAYAEQQNGMVFLRACVATVDGRVTLSAAMTLPESQVEELGEAVATQLLAQGAGKILQELQVK